MLLVSKCKTLSNKVVGIRTRIPIILHSLFGFDNLLSLHSNLRQTARTIWSLKTNKFYHMHTMPIVLIKIREMKVNFNIMLHSKNYHLYIVLR